MASLGSVQGMFYLTTHSTHFIYSYMVMDHSDSERGNPLPPHRLLSRVLLYASSHRQDNTYHSLWYTSRGILAGTRNSSMGPPNEGSIRRPSTPWANALTTELHLAPWICSCERIVRLLDIAVFVSCVVKDRSDDPSHHERTPLPRSYISLPGSVHVRESSGCLI